MRLKSKDIAEVLNLSTSTVSLALNNKPGVSLKTRNKVFEYVEEYYSSGTFAASEQKDYRVTGTIVLVVHKNRKSLIVYNNFFQEVISRIQAACMENYYMLEIKYLNAGMDNSFLLDSLSQDNVAGVIVYATELPYKEINTYLDIEKPMVILDARYPIPHMDMITLSNRSAVANAVEYAYNLGHRRIGFLRSHIMIPNFEDRYAGYLEGLRLMGLEFHEKYVYTIHCTLDGACADFMKILEENPVNELPTVFLTDLDYNVAGALRAIKIKGYSVPDDFSLIGFDDLELISELDPPLTTIGINPHFGTVAIDRLINKIKRNDDNYYNIEVATELIKRNSVKHLIVKRDHHKKS